MAAVGYVAQFGPLVHAVTVDRGVISFLRKWLPTYLHAAEVREGKPTSWLARPVVYVTTYDEDDQDFFADHRMPTCVVTASDLNSWTRTGAKQWSANCRVSISIVSRGRTAPESRLQSSLYAATLTDLLLDRPSLEGLAGGVTPVSERPRPITDPSNRSRVLSAGMGEYDLFIPNARQSQGGPLTPDPPPDPTAPYEPYPEATDVQVTVEGLAPPATPGSS